MHYFCESLILAESSSFPVWLITALSYVGATLLLAFGLGMVIFVHELGHFLAAKAVGIKVEVFSVGFGSRLFGFKRGETDYQVSAIPIGGYIKMLGQDDLHPEKRVDDERSFCNKSVGQRFLVIASGVVMNLICAAIMFIILFRFTGVVFQRAEVGDVLAGSPAELAGVLPGDRILAVDGKEVRDFGELTLRIALSHPDRDISLRIQRSSRNGPFEVPVQTEIEEQTGIPYIGIVGPASLIIDKPGDYTGPEGLEMGDQIIALQYDGQRHLCQKYYQFDEIIRSRRAKPTSIIAVRDGVELPPIMIRAHLAAGSHVMGLSAPSSIKLVQKDTPAEQAGLKPGDVIASFDGYAWPDSRAVLRIAQLSAEEGRDVTITVLRADRRIEIPVRLSEAKDTDAPLGIALDSDQQDLYVADSHSELYEKQKFPPPDLPGDEELDVPAGAKLLAVDGEPLANWSDLIDKLEARAGSRATLSYSIDGKEDRLAFAVPAADSPVWRQHWRFYVHLLPEPEETRVKSDSLTGAVYIGMHKTWFWLQGVYLTLTRVAQGTIETKALSGPVGIFNLGIQVAMTKGPAHFFYLMAIIGVNLAIVNFLPIPVLDGGHGLFLLIEKLKGSPVSVRVQTIASTVGLGLVGLFLLLVTYNDFLRLLGLN